MSDSCSRPATYRSSRDPGPWAVAIRRLHALNYSDRQIADTLCDLSTAAILTLDSLGNWSQQAIENVSEPESGTRWSKRSVWYHRRQMGLDANRQQASLTAYRNESRLIYQTEKRWGHLLPDLELRRTEVDILTTLRDYGPQTRAALCRAVGTVSLNTGGRSYLVRLQRADLIQGRKAGLYSLTNKATAYLITGTKSEAEESFSCPQE